MALTDDSDCCDFSVDISINESKLTPETIQNISDKIVSALAEYRAKELASETDVSSPGEVQPPIPRPSFHKHTKGHIKMVPKMGL